MLKKKVLQYLTCFVILILSFCFISSPSKVSAKQYMELDSNERIKYATEQYAEFYKKPEEQFTAIVNFNDISIDSLEELFSENSEILVSYHCIITSNGNVFTGCYDNVERIKAKNVLIAHRDAINSFTNATLLKLEEKYATLMSDGANEKYLKKESDANSEYYQVLQKLNQTINKTKEKQKALLDGKFRISGVKFKATGKEFLKIIDNNAVRLVELLEFDNNNIITPILHSEVYK